MGRRLSPVTIALLVIAAIVLPQLFLDACGPDLSPPTFTHESPPGVPLDAYAKGKLELLQPGFHRVYLFVAYRNLIGNRSTWRKSRP